MITLRNVPLLALSYLTLLYWDARDVNLKRMLLTVGDALTLGSVLVAVCAMCTVIYVLTRR